MSASILSESLLTQGLKPFTNDFPRADIYTMMCSDLHHQLIKGTFKDHLVTWIGEYLTREHGDARGKELLDEIDRRCVVRCPITTIPVLNIPMWSSSLALVPPFPGLRHLAGSSFQAMDRR